MAARSITEEAAERFDLGVVTDDGPYPGRLAIPYLTAKGAWYCKFRCIAEHDCRATGHGKYVNTPGIEAHLFNAHTLLDSEQVVITEGELDAVAVEALGLPAVGYPGADQWARNKFWSYCFEDQAQIVVIADNDDPGRKAAEGVAASLRDAVAGDVRVVHIPGTEHGDASSFITEHGAEAFKELVDLECV